MSSEEVRVILPAAGFGTRVGSPVSKEMMPSPRDQKPLINFALDLAQEFSFSTHVITRSEKVSLLQHLEKRTQAQKISKQEIVPSKEWPDTILKSEPYWTSKNLLVLPDTVFHPTTVLADMTKRLEDRDVVFGVFRPLDFKTWGVVEARDGKLFHCEKPQTASQGALAWGLIAFRNSIGRTLFESLLASTLDHQWRALDFNFEFVQLESFEDLTR